MADWSMYNDIFVSGEYDIAIRRALSKADGCCRVLDLGANVGIFAKRLLHIRRSEFPNTSLELICVEGLPSTHKLLKRFFPALNPQESAQLLHGLAGERSGSAKITPNTFHAMTSLTRGRRRGVAVKFLDLDELTRDWKAVDLIKCDIEGAESLVLETYADLFKRTQFTVIEFHSYLVDPIACRKHLLDSGLGESLAIHANEHISVAFFERIDDRSS